MSSDSIEMEFPCSLTITTPFPTARLASFAQQALSVDEELSPLVRRSFSLASAESEASSSAGEDSDGHGSAEVNGSVAAGAVDGPPAEGRTGTRRTLLRTHYRATTNRMLRVSVNGFFESLAVVLQVMEELDVDVLDAKRQAG